MKTIKETADEIRKALGNGLRYDPILTTGKSLLETLVGEVVSDARKSALTEAAEICEARNQQNELVGSTYLAGESYDCRKAIEAKRDAAEPANSEVSNPDAKNPKP